MICDEYCTKGMQRRIETHPNYATRIEDNPIVLLKEIQKLIHKTVQAQYSLLMMHEVIKALVNVKKKDGKELLDLCQMFQTDPYHIQQLFGNGVVWCTC